jgi:hypothetical protein
MYNVSNNKHFTERLLKNEIYVVIPWLSNTVSQALNTSETWVNFLETTQRNIQKAVTFEVEACLNVI